MAWGAEVTYSTQTLDLPVWTQPLPEFQNRLDRWMCRLLCRLANRYVLEVQGDLSHLKQDPCIFVLNHSQRLEALVIPALMAFWRNGKKVRFLADWQMALVPGIGWLYRRNHNILVCHKPHKLKALNVFRPKENAFRKAKGSLQNGQSLGIFVEGTMNRNPQHLLKGKKGAARLALETGVPIIPIGIRFPQIVEKRISDFGRMILQIGHPIQGSFSNPTHLHREIMQNLALYTHKTWPYSEGEEHVFISSSKN